MNIEEFAKGVSYALGLIFLILAGILIVVGRTDRIMVLVGVAVAAGGLLHSLWLYLVAENVGLLRQIKREQNQSD